MAEELKDRWNREVEKLVRNVQETDWTAARENAERRLAEVWSRVRQSETGREIEGRAAELSEQVRTGVKEGIAEGRGKLREAVDAGGRKVVDGKEEIKKEAQPRRLLEIA